MEYIPTPTDIAFAKKVYDEVIWTQVLNPVLVNEAHKRLFGHNADNKAQAKVRVFNWFQYQFKPEMLKIDSTETTLPKNGELGAVGVESTMKVNYTPDGVQYNPEMISGFHVEDNDGQSHSEDYLVKNSELIELTDEEIMETLSDKDAIIKPKRSRKPKK